MKSDKIPLYTIAKCNLKDRESSQYWIPNIQRGLVWKAIQMELLWDSILRGFPIGSMLILEQGPERGEILDGQQRANAIIAGFNIDSLLGDKQKPNTIIWLDLAFEPSESDKERREFGIRVTNSSHPWGYDEDGGKLSAKDRRDSIELAYDCACPRNKSEWDIRRFIPFYYQKQIESKFMPVPLAILVNAAEGITDNSNEIYWRKVKDSLLEFSKYAPYWKNHYLTPILNQIEQFLEPEKDRFFNAFFGLNTYEVVFNYVTSNDDIELLFNRVNKRGTAISSQELTYAALKHYSGKLCGQEEIGQVIKECSDGFMMEHIFAQIALRYCFSDKRIHGEISAEQIRTLAFSTNNEKNNRIIDNIKCFFIKEKLEKMLDDVKKVLLTSYSTNSKLPNLLIAEVASNKPELIVLLLEIIIKRKNVILNNLDNVKFFHALIYYLYCFSLNNEPINRIFEIVQKESNEDLIKLIQNELRDSISREWCYPIVQSFEGFPGLDEKNFNDTWRIDQFVNEKGYDAFRFLFDFKAFQGRFMLTYVLNEFFQYVFGDFNPSQLEYWADINRPWDHDHIIPKSWVPDGKWNIVMNSWINSIGNIADIPFEENRSKNDNPNWDYYDAHSALLHFKEEFKMLTPQSLSHEKTVVETMRTIKSRFLDISNIFLNIFTSLELNQELSPKQKERKFFLEECAKVLGDHELFYRERDGKETLIKNKDDIDIWQSKGVSLIKMNGREFRRAITIFINENRDYPFRIARGNRNMVSIDPLWEPATLYETSTFLFSNQSKIISPVADTIIKGSSKYNNNSFCGFYDSNYLMSCRFRINGVELQSYIYEYYKCQHCYIEPIESNQIIPQVLKYGIKNILNRCRIELGDNINDKYIDFYLSGTKFDLNKVCLDFVKVMREINSSFSS